MKKGCDLIVSYVYFWALRYDESLIVNKIIKILVGLKYHIKTGSDGCFGIIKNKDICLKTFKLLCIILTSYHMLKQKGSMI